MKGSEMAKILLESVKVDKAGNGHCTAVEEYTRNDGSTGKTWFKVWAKTPVEVGDVIKVTGIMSAKPAVDFATGEERKWTDRAGKEHTSIEVHVNDAVITKLSGGDPF
jgi:hypothetical protein